MSERVCKFGPNRALVGIYTEASKEQTDRPTVLLFNAGLLHRVGQNRLNVSLAREVAAQGFPAFRFDFSGLGDSASQASEVSVRERQVAEMSAAMDFLEHFRGASQFVLVGLCTGADNAHRAAVSDKRVSGIVMLDGYSFVTLKYIVRRFRNKLLKLTHMRNFVVSQYRRITRSNRAGDDGAKDGGATFFWELPKKKRVIAELRDLTNRGVRQLQVFSGSHQLYNYEGQYRAALNAVDFKDQLTVMYLSKADHTLSMRSDREPLIGDICDWLNDGFPTTLDH
ncbi:MAG: hypothetical protein AAF385_10490 [Pseudomonadota bacterium]